MAARPAKKKPTGETVRLRIGNLAKAVLVTGQAYQDPKDALNELVSNAADEYVQSGRQGARIRVALRRKGAHPTIAVDDNGRGMSPDRLREVARNLFESTKVNDERTLGEKAIGLLAFQQLGGRCDVVSRDESSADTWALRFTRVVPRLLRSNAAPPGPCHARHAPSTSRISTPTFSDCSRSARSSSICGSRRGAALGRGDYELEVVEGRNAEIVTADKPDGIKLELPALPTLWGTFEFALFVAPHDGKRRRVAVVGRGGTTIVDDIADLDEFAAPPWTSDQVAGRVVFEALQQSAGRRAILRDRDVFPVFLETMRAIEPGVVKAIERIAKQVDVDTAERMADTVRKLFGKVLRELADIDNPMRTPVGSEAGVGALLDGEFGDARGGPGSNGVGDGPSRSSSDEPTTSIDDLVGKASDPVQPVRDGGRANPDRRRSSRASEHCARSRSR